MKENLRKERGRNKGKVGGEKRIDEGNWRIKKEESKYIDNGSFKKKEGEKINKIKK